MALAVLLAFGIQAAVGVVLLTGWWRHGRASKAVVAAHVGPALLAFALWAVFVLDGSVGWGWASLGVLTVANTFGDELLRARARRLVGRRSFWRDYGAAVVAVLRGRFPRPVTFHALFAGVVYFGSSGVCLVETL